MLLNVEMWYRMFFTGNAQGAGLEKLQLSVAA